MTKEQFLELASKRIDRHYTETAHYMWKMNEFTQYGPLSDYYSKEWSKFKTKPLALQKDRLATIMLRKRDKEADKYARLADEVFSAELPTDITISVEWKKSRMWGSNPTCTIRVSFSNFTCLTYKAGPVSGCGYDKESTAIADACAQSPSITRLLFMADEADERGVYGYHRPTDGYMPHLNGGVGTSCYPEIFALAGYEMKKIASGGMYDVWMVTKKS